MLIKFNPVFEITSKVANSLMRIEAARQKIQFLPLTPIVLASLRESARLYTTHYSTMIEGNSLNPDQIEEVLLHQGHFPGKERDEFEVKGYYAALTKVEQWAAKNMPITEKIIQMFHALIMAGGKIQVAPSDYRDGQNVIRDGRTRQIVYLPPEAVDVPGLMAGMVAWIGAQKELPAPLVAAVAHYQFATIHPYYDGNGRTARLLTTYILHAGGYDLKGLYSLEEYYARNLGAYYDAISVGDSHNYYMGRAEADITKWVEYFVEGMAVSCENVVKRMQESQVRGERDYSLVLRELDPKQRKVLELFQEYAIVTAKQIGALFGFQPRSSTQLCKQWVESGFLEVVDFSNKNRKYRLAQKYAVALGE